MEALGVDIGGVLSDRFSDQRDISLVKQKMEKYLDISPIEGSFEALGILNAERFMGNIFIVSKCGKTIEENTLEWLEYQNFYSITGVKKANLHFCRKRSDKAGIAEELGLTHFVDDRLENLGFLRTVPNLYLFRPREKEVQQFADLLPLVARAQSWMELHKLLSI